MERVTQLDLNRNTLTEMNTTTDETPWLALATELMMLPEALRIQRVAAMPWTKLFKLACWGLAIPAKAMDAYDRTKSELTILRRLAKVASHQIV